MTGWPDLASNVVDGPPLERACFEKIKHAPAAYARHFGQRINEGANVIAPELLRIEYLAAKLGRRDGDSDAAQRHP
jgi:hypothetical protein